jgi:hypothetical protein
MLKLDLVMKAGAYMATDETATLVVYRSAFRD